MESGWTQADCFLLGFPQSLFCDRGMSHCKQFILNMIQMFLGVNIFSMWSEERRSREVSQTVMHISVSVHTFICKSKWSTAIRKPVNSQCLKGNHTSDEHIDADRQTGRYKYISERQIVHWHIHAEVDPLHTKHLNFKLLSSLYEYGKAFC